MPCILYIVLDVSKVGIHASAVVVYDWQIVSSEGIWTHILVVPADVVFMSFKQG